MILVDGFDSLKPGAQEWLEFRTAFAAGRLQAWLVAELDQAAPTFFRDIDRHFQQSLDEAEDRASRNPEHDWAEVELPGGVVWTTEAADVMELRDQLFPHRAAEADFPYRARCLALVAMHGALEGFCAAVGVSTKGPLPDNIYTRLSLTSGMPDDLFRRLKECDALRHLIVHAGGIVDDKFQQKVRWLALATGERHPLSDRDLWEKGDVLWQVAKLLHAAGVHL